MKRAPLLMLLTVALAAAACGESLGTAIGPLPDGGGGAPTSAIKALWVGAGGTACAAGNGAVYLREPQDKAWRQVPLSDQDTSLLKNVRLFGVVCTSAGAIVAVGSEDTSPPALRIAVLTRAAQWKLQLQSPVSEGDLFAITPISSQELLAVGYKLGTGGGGVPATLGLKSTAPAAGTWIEDSRLIGNIPLRGIWVRPDGRRVAVGSSGALLGSAGDAQPYVPAANPRGAPTMRAVWAPGNLAFMAAGDGDSLLREMKNGTWKVMAGKINKSANWHAIHGTSEANIFAVGGQYIAHYDGIAWQQVPNISGLPAALDLRAVRLDGSTQPARLHLAGDKLLATCEIKPGTPPALVCRQ